MRFKSLCSGIEAASVAWTPMGWEAVDFSEIDRFACAVLAHHYPHVPNLGDMGRFKEWPDADVDVLVGGTPCQSFSVAGLRRGLADPRGNLALTYLAIADRYRPEWLVWENVPGVLSSAKGRDFGSFLGGLGELGYGFAYRVLDAQFFGVAQRRRRVFVVANSRSWQRAAAVLFERESLRGDPAPSRETGQEPAQTIDAGLGRRRGSGMNPNALTVGTLDAAGDRGGTLQDARSGRLIAFGGNNTAGPVHVAAALQAHSGPHGRQDFATETFVCAPPLTGNLYGDHESREGLLVAHSLRGEGFDGSEDGTGRGTPLVPICFDARQTDVLVHGDRTGPLDTGLPGPAVTLGLPSAVRRLTPRECERLQGFPDDYTLIPYRGKPASDVPRYKALGNSMAVPVMSWIGRRMAAVHHGAI